MNPRLSIEKEDGDLYYNVYEVVVHRPFGMREVTKFYSGHLTFSTGMNEGWWFISSDDSIKWFLGPRVRDAMKELRKRYLKSKGR